MLRRAIRYGVLVGVVAFLAAQSVRPDRANPPHDPAASFETVAAPPKEVAAAVHRSCGDCHSNRTEWPWYAGVAPMSWLLAKDVREGRAHLNLSEWSRYSPEMSQLRMREMCEEARAGKMPPWQYTLMHRDAKLSASELAGLCGAPVAQR